MREGIKLKIEDKDIKLINNKGNKKTNVEKEKSFKCVLEGVIKNKNMDIDNSKNIADMEKLLDIDIRNNKDKYVKDNGKINILDIIDQYGGKVGSRKLQKFSGIVTGLYKEGLIDEKDYFKAIKWITLKIKQKSTQVKIEAEKKNQILNLV